MATDSDGVNFVTDDNSGGYFVYECECGHVGNSGNLSGGSQIADTGDYDDAFCPKCGTPAPDECNNANKAWNVQQNKINNLLFTIGLVADRIEKAIVEPNSVDFEQLRKALITSADCNK